MLHITKKRGRFLSSNAGLGYLIHLWRTGVSDEYGDGQYRDAGASIYRFVQLG